jgi:hypothetical protein
MTKTQQESLARVIALGEQTVEHCDCMLGRSHALDWREWEELHAARERFAHGVVLLRYMMQEASA